MSNEEKIFADGVYFKLPSEKAPGFIKGRLSFKVAEFSAFLSKHESNAGWVNLDIKESKGGKYYVELDTFQPTKRDVPESKPPVDEEESEEVGPVPF